MHLRQRPLEERLLIAGLSALVLLALFFSWEAWEDSRDRALFQGALTPLQIGTSTIMVEVVDTKEKRDKGLSGRERLPKGEGMLFVFEEPNFYTFWMPDMRFAIDIIWISSEKRVVDITPGVPPDSYPQLFSPEEPAQYVLEVPAGVVMKEGWGVGDSVQF